MNLSSSYLAALPSKCFFISEGYISGLLNEFKWSHHGSTLDKFISEHIDYDSFPLKEEFMSQDADHTALVKTEQFKGYLENYLKSRYDFVIKEIRNELSASLTKELELERTLYVAPSLLKSLELEDLPLGVHWSTCQSEAHGATEKDGILITVSAVVMPYHIDWKQTLISRFDYDHGDEEMEIVLTDDAIPLITKIYNNDVGEYMNIKSRENKIASMRRYLDRPTESSNSTRFGGASYGC
jgi:hypothetical protein